MAMNKVTLGASIRSLVQGVPYPFDPENPEVLPTPEELEDYAVAIFEKMAEAFITHLQNNAEISITGIPINTTVISNVEPFSEIGTGSGTASGTGGSIQ